MNNSVLSQKSQPTSIFSFKVAPPLSLYIHLPWCIRKCPYCDFNSHELSNGSLPEARYIEALLRDVEAARPAISDRGISSIFIGGGTPSLFSPDSVSLLLAEIRHRLEFSEDIEITLEANPGAVDTDHFFGYRDAGVNRLSLGIQSFNDNMLKRLGRIHDAASAQNAVSAAIDVDFDRVNLDLMYGLPGQRSNEAMDDLKRAIEYSTGHISWYQLTIEPNTVFYTHRPELPGDDDIWTMQDEGQALLKDAGYLNYEISAHGLPGHECRHNLNYWSFGDYLGIGAGAHSKYTDIECGVIVRQARHRIPDRYIDLAGNKDVITDEKYLDESDVILEFMMNALRLRDGFKLPLFEERTGLSASVIETPLAMAVDRGWLQWTADHIQASHKGQIFLNDLLQCFMADNDKDSANVPVIQ
jgi:oxygen-independent coproporphyrinogen-3 oxidase